MSQDISLYLLEADIPTPRQWAKAIREQGFKFKLNTDFDIKDCAGFVPCGEDAGFELVSAEMTQEEHDQLCFAEPQIDWSITLSAQGDADFQIALAALGCLGSITGGRIIDQQTGEIIRAETALERAHVHFAKAASAKRVPDPLDKAIKQILQPVLMEFGFRKLKKRFYYRIRHRVAQYFYFEKSSRHTNHFYVEVAAELLMPHRTGISYSSESSFRVFPPDGAVVQCWPFGDTAQATESMEAIAEQFRTIVTAFFGRMSDEQAFVDLLKDVPLDAPHAHEFSRIGCSLLNAGDVAGGLPYVQRARAAYQQLSDEFRAAGTPEKRLWPDAHIPNMDALLAAVADGTYRVLLDTWYRESLATLKLTEG